MKPNHLSATSETFHFEKLGESILYISTFTPFDQPSKTQVVLICDALWDEQDRTLLVNTKLSRLLASHGYTVIRFDYSGSGNSGFSNGYITFETMATDLNNMKAWCASSFPKAELHTLICERVSCNLVFTQPTLTSGFRKTIFVHPILNLSHFFKWNFVEREIINSNAYSNAGLSETQLIGELQTQSEISLNGFEFDVSFVRTLLGSKAVWNCDLQEKNCLYIFDEGYYRIKDKWKDTQRKIEMVIISMRLASRTNWDSEDLKHDKVFLEDLFSTILNYATGDGDRGV